MPGRPGRTTARARRARPDARKRKASPAGQWRRALRLLRDVSPLLGLLLVFLAVLALDPAAVLRLLWDCVTGAFGAAVQLVVSALVAAAAALIALSFWLAEPAEPSGRDASRRGGMNGRP